MKKILTLFTAIAFSGTILIAGSCGDSSKQAKSTTGGAANTHNVVIIHLKEINGQGQLKMSDSNNPSFTATDDLETEVYPGTTVLWIPKKGSGIKEIMTIMPFSRGNIMNKAAEHIPNSNRLMYEVPLNAPMGEKEKYIILIKDDDDNTHLIDPYLKIPPDL